MKFSEKLVRKRKDNNLSQELLADRLKMSRQAISKWELGTSYPDMSTIMELCKILNCTIDELLDDNVVGVTNAKTSSKFNVNVWIKDLLSFVTKTYNMFCSMKFIEKIKCLLEIIILILVFILCWNLLGSFINNMSYRFISLFPEKAITILKSTFTLFYNLIGGIVGFIIIVHLFKIRYLDYYVTVEDTEIKEKKEEKPIKENELKRESKYNKTERVIIRDAKHSSYSFINGLAKIVVFIIKLFVSFCLFFFILAFIFESFGAVFSITLFKYGIFFVGIFICILGILLITYLFIECLYNFILDRKNNYKKAFIIFIVGLFLIGSGAAVSFSKYLTFNHITDVSKYLITTTNEIEMSDNLVLGLFEDETTVIIEEDRDNILFEIKSFKGTYPYTYEYNHLNYRAVEMHYQNNFPELFTGMMEMFKNNETVDNYNEDYYETTIYISPYNLNKIKNNNSEFYE